MDKIQYGNRILNTSIKRLFISIEFFHLLIISIETLVSFLLLTHGRPLISLQGVGVLFAWFYLHIYISVSKYLYLNFRVIYERQCRKYVFEPLCLNALFF